MSEKKFGFTIGQILGGLLIALLTGGGVGGFSIHKYYAEKIENLARQNGQIETKVSEYEKKIETRETQLKEKDAEIVKLMNTLEDIKEKYRKCISSKSAIYKLDSDDTEIHIGKNLCNGNQIEISLTSFSFYCKVIRVTKKGPVIKIIGCQNFRTRNGLKSLEDGEAAFVLTPNTPLKLIFSSQSCEEGDLLSDSKSREEVIFLLKDYNLEEQTLNLQYWRKFLTRE